MSDPGQVSSVKGQLWRNLIANPAPKSPWPSALRRGLLVAAIMAIGALSGHLPQAAVVSIGALNMGFVDGAVPRRTLTQAMLTVTVLTTLATFVAALAGLVLVGSILQALTSTLAWRRERQAAVLRSVLIATAALRALIFADPPIERHNLDTATVEVQARQTLKVPAYRHQSTLPMRLSWPR